MVKDHEEPLQGKIQGKPRRDKTVQAKAWQKESCELPCLGQALPGEGWLFPGKTLRLKDGSLEMALLPQEPKGFSRVEQDTHMPLLLLDEAPESSLGTSPTPSHSLFFPSSCCQLFSTVQGLYGTGCYPPGSRICLPLVPAYALTLTLYPELVTQALSITVG